MSTVNISITHAFGFAPKKTKSSFSRLIAFLFSTKRNTIIDKRIQKLEDSMNLVWSDLSPEERVSYMYNKAATLRAIVRMEMLKN